MVQHAFGEERRRLPTEMWRFCAALSAFFFFGICHPKPCSAERSAAALVFTVKGMPQEREHTHTSLPPPQIFLMNQEGFQGVGYFQPFKSRLQRATQHSCLEAWNRGRKTATKSQARRRGFCAPPQGYRMVGKASLCCPRGQDNRCVPFLWSGKRKTVSPLAALDLPRVNVDRGKIDGVSYPPPKVFPGVLYLKSMFIFSKRERERRLFRQFFFEFSKQSERNNVPCWGKNKNNHRLNAEKILASFRSA